MLIAANQQDAAADAVPPRIVPETNPDCFALTDVAERRLRDSLAIAFVADS